jgi:hypothetical protein
MDVPIPPPWGLLPPPLIVPDRSKSSPSRVTTRRNSFAAPYAIREAWQTRLLSTFLKHKQGPLFEIRTDMPLISKMKTFMEGKQLPQKQIELE